MNIETARAFLGEYLKQSYETDLLGLKKDPGYRAAWFPTTRHWLEPANGHPKVWPASDEAKRHKQIDNRLLQRVFRLSQYSHPTYGTIVRAVISSPERDWGAPGYYVRWGLAEIDGVLKLIAEDNFCNACVGMGRVPEGRRSAGGVCPDCDGIGWRHVRGVQSRDLDAPSQVVRVEDPEDPRHLAAHHLDM